MIKGSLFFVFNTLNNSELLQNSKNEIDSKLVYQVIDPKVKTKIKRSKKVCKEQLERNGANAEKIGKRGDCRFWNNKYTIKFEKNRKNLIILTIFAWWNNSKLGITINE